jgi:folate-binding protein YgfZ
MIADLYISKRENTFYLQLSHDLVGVLLKKLRMYVMMSKVTLDDVSEQLIYFGYAGNNATQLLVDCIGTAPTQPNETIQYQSLSITRITGKISRFTIIGEVQDAQQLWVALAPQANSVSSHAWQYLDIATGLPNISADSSTAWVPQMLNFERIGGISFTKGCYPGQEIVARLNYLGQTKRRTYRLLAHTDQLAAVGDKIIMANSEGKTSEAGQVLNAALNPEGQLEMLAVLKSASIDQSLSWNDIAIEVLKLPYTLEDN